MTSFKTRPFLGPTTWILSYPRSGNHLVRTFVEYMTKRPTIGCFNDPQDPPIYKRNEELRTTINISKPEDVVPVAIKSHFASDIATQLHSEDNLILLLRSPIECVTSHKDNHKSAIAKYQKNLDFFMQFKNKKLLLFYEDMKNQHFDKFLESLGEFFNCDSEVIMKTIKNKCEIEKAALSALLRKPKSNADVRFYVKRSKKKSLQVNKKYKNILSRYSAHLVFV